MGANRVGEEVSDKLQPQRKPYYSEKLVAILPSDFVTLSLWSKAHNHSNALPVNLIERYVIAQYQVGDAFKWTAGNNCRYQQLAAGITHLMCCAEHERLQTYAHLDSIDFNHYPFVDIDEGAVSTALIQTAKQIFYRHQRHRSDRAKRRSNGLLLSKSLAQIIELLISGIPKGKRTESFYHEMRIICGDLD
jgi:hypothetical protein